jgi:hypothetical protein
MISRLLFGEDIFISYSRVEGSLYATGLADELTKLQFSCFIDRLGTVPGKDLPKTLKSKIRNSTLLVLVGTKSAFMSQPVREELEEFVKTKRTIVPIYFGEVPKDSLLNSIIPGLASSVELPESLETGDPSESVVNRVVKSFNYARRNEKLRRLTWVTVVSVVLLLGGSVGASYLIIGKANKAAQAALSRAQKAEADAVEANTKAQEALKQATIERLQSQNDKHQRFQAEQKTR